MTYKVGIIGLGRIGLLLETDPLREKPCSHVGAFTLFPECEIVAVCDLNESYLSGLPHISKEETKFYVYYEKMMEENDLDIVSVATPTETHAEIVMKVATYMPKLIWCEKPIATNLKDAEAMIDTCKRYGVKLAINHTRRWHPLYQHVKELLVRGEIGGNVETVGYFSGDAVNDGVHMFDLLLWLSNGENCVPVHCDVNYLIFELDLIGEKGRIRILDNGRILEVWHVRRSDRYTGYRELFMTDFTLNENFDNPNPWINAVRDLIDTIEEDREPLCTGEDGLKALKLCLEWMNFLGYKRM